MSIFKTRKPESSNFKTPQEMYDDYKTRAIEGIHDYQSKMIDSYMDINVINRKDVAMELPTGTGKTLIGLLIGEYRRRKFNEKILYLCPTKQLVYQTVENAVNKFGIKAVAFTGSKHDYDVEIKGKYNSAEVIGVTTYSSLFNTDPYFKDADILIFDDAHSGENYIATNWTVDISRTNDKELYFKVLNAVKELIAKETYYKLIEEEQQIYDFNWVDKIPNFNLVNKYTYIQDCIDSYIDSFEKRPNLSFPWENIRDYLHACNIFLSYGNIVVRPFIPPTRTHRPFENAKQRIYMSATLGKSGELERSFGVNKIHTLPMVKDWENKTIGRKFFMFPDLSFEAESRGMIILGILKNVNRAIMLVNDDKTKDKILKFIKENMDIETFDAKYIEKTKEPFIKSDHAIAIMSNRFDGIDFPNEECRVLILFDLPTATHLQEKFLITCMASNVLFEERIKTRVVQALGRCTRSHSDYAAVCIFGDDLMNNLLSPKRLSQFNPELQAEINFGKDNSVDYTNINDYLELLNTFINKREVWRESDAEESIISDRDSIMSKITDSYQNEAFSSLKKTAYFEVEAQYCIWKKDFVSALENITEITSRLRQDALKGYKGFWYYTGACCAYQTFVSSSEECYKKVFNDYLGQASQTTIAIKWFNNFNLINEPQTDKYASLMEYTIERMEQNFQSKYDTLDKFYSQLNNIRDLLNSKKSEDFEKGQLLLGKLLGYISVKYNDNKYPGCPDPIWTVHEGMTIVFEDKLYENESLNIPLNDVKQAAGHENWVKELLDKPKINKDAEIIIVFISNRDKIDKPAKIHGEKVYFLHIDEYLKWAEKCLKVLKSARMKFDIAGDVIWRENTILAFEQNEIAPQNFVHLIMNKKMSEM